MRTKSLSIPSRSVFQMEFVVAFAAHFRLAVSHIRLSMPLNYSLGVLAADMTRRLSLNLKQRLFLN